MNMKKKFKKKCESGWLFSRIVITMEDSENVKYIRNHGKSLSSVTAASLNAVLTGGSRLVQMSADRKRDAAAGKNVTRHMLITALGCNKNFTEIFGPLQPDFRKNFPFRKAPRFCY